MKTAKIDILEKGCAGLYQKEEPEPMAAVRAAKEGKQPPGKMYSLMKSELCL